MLKVLEGEHTVVYDIVNPRGVAFIPDYANESFEQKVLSQDEFSKRVQVTSKMHPLKTRIAYPVPARRHTRFRGLSTCRRKRTASPQMPSILRTVQEDNPGQQIHA